MEPRIPNEPSRYPLTGSPFREDSEGLGEATLWAILNATKESIFLFDTTGVVLLGNETALGRWPLRLEEIVGHHITEFTTPELAKSRLATMAEVVATGNPVESFDERDGILFHHTFYPVRDPKGRITRLACFSRDITLQKRTEADLRRALAEAEEGRVLLKALVERLERSNRDLAQFAYISSHDLQEPLRQVRAYVDLLRTRHARELSPEAAVYFSFVEEGATRMSALIEGLLAYAQVGSGGTPASPRTVQGALEEALENLQATFRETRAIFTQDPLPEGALGPLQLAQVFQNLIGNALKFRREGVTPRVHVGFRDDGQAQVFSVQDNGIGIEPEFQDRIFLLFQRLHARETFPGTGLGLAICKKIIEQVHGRIWVEATQGQGSTFFFTLRPPERGGGSMENSSDAPPQRGES